MWREEVERKLAGVAVHGTQGKISRLIGAQIRNEMSDRMSS
jgi:hypothetical protein